ncbi:hypothetical protein ACR0ST_04425 [Aliidiomarina sp. Khilg15.8]
MATWWYATSVDVTNGSNQVKVNTGDDIRYLERGSAYLKVAGFEAVETDGAFESPQGDKIIRLAKNWEGQTNAALAATAFRTVPDFQSVAEKLSENIERAKAFYDSFSELPQADTVVVRDSGGRVKTANAEADDDAIALGQAGSAYSKDAQTNKGDATSGRLMVTGAFGLGNLDSLENNPGDNTKLPSGFGRNSDNYPVAVGTVLGRPSALRSFEYAASFTVPDRFFGRTQSSNDTWRPPVEFYHDKNLLGSVSQSGGLPTGAVIERGSNSNGDYVKYADGTMICWFTNLQQFEPGTRSDSLIRLNEWIYPSQFSSPPSINAALLQDLQTESGFRAYGFIGRLTSQAPSPLSTGAVFALASASNGTTSETRWSIQAIGRWY